MKKFLSILLALCLLMSLAACGGERASEPTTTAAPTQTTAAPTEATTPQASIDALEGKRVLFIGNSYTYWGSVVINKDKTVMDQKSRTGDKGMFYHMCRQKGIEPVVTNWVWGSHNFTDIMSHECLCEDNPCEGKDHMSYFTDAAFDYVCMQPYFETEYASDLVTHLTPAMDFFRQANPEVKFLLLVPHMAFVKQFRWRDELQAAADAGITVVNWGGMLDDIVNKRVEVPGATEQYFLNTFVISKSKEDGHHQNLLVGYLTAMMVYCAITGENAAGQPYAFADDRSLHPNFDMETFRAVNYTHDTFTNFVEVYRSEADMLGLQQLADRYLTKYNGGN